MKADGRLSGCRNHSRKLLVSRVSAASIRPHFAGFTDPRRRKPNYSLMGMVVMALTAVSCGADDFVPIAKFASTKKDWFGTFPNMSKGVPSHDRLNAVFGEL